MPCLSVDLGFFNRYIPMSPKNDGNSVTISQAQPSFWYQGK
jgi:hypothetical protein